MAQTATEDTGRQVQLSFRIPADQAAALEKAAASEDRTVSAELRRMIRRYLAQLQTQEVA